MNKKLKTLLVFLYYLCFSELAFIPFHILNINLTAIPDSLYYTYYISTQIIFTATLIFIYYKDLIIYLEDFKKNGKKHLKDAFPWWFKGLCVMVISNIIISLLSPINLPENEQVIRKILNVSPWFIIFSSVIIAPIVEETLFRKAISDMIKDKRIYILISGLLFGAMHIIGVATSLYSWLYVIPYAALGVAFAYAYVKTNNLITSICLHSFHNLITLLQLLFL